MTALGNDVTQFANVDRAADPRYFIEFLDARKSIEGERAVKELIIEMLDLKPGAHVLDVGSGTGDDAREIASIAGPNGRVTGVDLNETLVAESRKRATESGSPVDFLRGDVRALDLPSASFDRVRTDRVLMFVPEIDEAISEIVRVLRPGGRVATSEIDHETHFIDSDRPDISRKFYAAFATSNPQPCLGRRLHRLLAEHGLRDVKTVPRVIRPPYAMFQRVFAGFVASAVASGQLDRAEIDSWLGELAALNKSGLFNSGVTVFTATGEKP
jgi:ubiquinone/menaquinone biosynthesis C-methylase UbiE